MRDLLDDASKRAIRYLDGLRHRGVMPDAAALPGLAELDGTLPEQSCAPAETLRLLDDFDRLQAMYRPAVFGCYLIAALAVVLAALRPPALLFALAIFVAMCVQWTLSVIRWLGTPDGIAKLEESDAPFE